MAYVLSLPPHSPLKRSFSDTPYLRSCSSLSLVSSTGTVRHDAGADPSPAPFIPSVLRPNALTSLPNGHIRPLRTTSTPLDLALKRQDSPLSTKSRDGRLSAANTTVEAGSIHISSPGHSTLHTCELSSSESLAPLTRVLTPEITIRCDSQGPDNDAANDKEHEPADAKKHVAEDPNVLIPETGLSTENLAIPPFKRWVSTLRRRNADRKREPVDNGKSVANGEVDAKPCTRKSMESSGHRKSESHSSSMGFIGAVKSASVTLASVSVGPLRSRASRIHLNRRRNRSSDVRTSFDSNVTSPAPAIDEATWWRAVQRRKVLEEILSTEESYIADMKAFVNVFQTLLASMPATSQEVRTSMEQTMLQIIQLHEDLSAQLQKTVPHVQHTLETSSAVNASKRPRHMRWHSAENVPRQSDVPNTARRLRHSFDAGRMKDPPHAALTADTQTAAQVGKVFGAFMHRFLVYEAWAAQSERLHDNVLMIYKTVPGSRSIERGVEILSRVEGPINHKSAYSRKGLTLLDLLIKPIQRVCKYPLLFESLCKQTPACDDPTAHENLQKILVRLREMTDEVNKATDDPATRTLVEVSWLLRDRLVFNEDVSQAVKPEIIFHLLGRVILCGTFFLAYETQEGICGRYVIAILYRSCILFATPGSSSSQYMVLGGITLSKASIEEADNGKGLQCLTAPYTWKMMFESTHRLYEIMLSACTPLEEGVWRSYLQARITVEKQNSTEGHPIVYDLFCSVLPQLKPIGSALGQPGSLARRTSIQRAATLATNKLPIRHVTIKNTDAQREPAGAVDQRDTGPARSQSHLSTYHTQTLAPRRADRIRLESLIADVWTKDFLPYPGMMLRRSENPIRASASSVMRKLSMASIASNFSKRSASFASVSNGSSRTASAASIDEGYIPLSNARRFQSTGRSTNGSGRSSRRAKVDFQTAPDAFLPRDFELPMNQTGRSKVENDGRSKTLTSRMAGLGFDFGFESARSLRPLSPIIASGPPTPRGMRAMSMENESLSKGTTPRSSLMSRRLSTSPAKERAKLTKAPKTMDLPKDTEPRNRPYDNSRVTTDSITNDNRLEAPAWFKEDKKSAKVRTKLLRFWTG